MTLLPPSEPFLREVNVRASTARHVIRGFAFATPALAELWRLLDSSLSDIPVLVTEVTRQSAALSACRLSRANLAAAGLAAVAAWHSGEPDPLSYLRDELAAQGFERRRA